MAKIASLPTIAGALVAYGLSAAPAQAVPNRTWVSGKGADSGACTLEAPCRTFAFALTQTAAGGEIDVLDPAGYGPVAITKAISIVNDGVGTAAIHPAALGSNGITINAGPGDSVHLRGLTIEGLGSPSVGIQFLTGANLAIENCVVRNFAGAAINIAPSTTSSFSMSNTIASNSNTGILIEPSRSAVVTGVLSKVTANNNPNGILVTSLALTSGASLNVTVVDSVASNNSTVGIDAISPKTAVMVRNSVVSNNGAGLVTTGAVLRVAHSVVTGNNIGLNTSGGTLFSYGDNDINGNTTDNTAV